MKSEILAQGMTAADLDKLDLIADVQFFEPMGSAALNRKFYGIMPPGIYRGFQAVVRGGLKVSVGDSPVNVAAVDVDGFMITVQGRRPVELTVPVGRKVYGIIEANYAVGRKTTQVDINASIKAADIRIINPEEKRSNHVVIFSANLPAGTTEIRADQIDLTERQEADIGSDAIDRHTKNYLNPHQVNKGQIGLSDVENYGVATVEEAQAGTATHKYMTPALTKTAIESISSPVPLPDVWIPFNDSLRMITGFGDYDRVYIGEQYLELNSRSASFERATTATYIDKSGVLRTAAINEPRFEKQGLLIEGQSTNLLTNSSSPAAITDPRWTSEITSLGGMMAAKIKPASAGSPTAIGNIFGVSGNPTGTGAVTFSFYTDRALEISSRDGDVYVGGVTAKAKLVGSFGGIHRYSASFVFDSSVALAAHLYPSTELVITGLQLEPLPFASSYIPTNGTAVTRGADKCWIRVGLNVPPICGNVTIALEVVRNKTVPSNMFPRAIHVSSAQFFVADSTRLMARGGGSDQVSLMKPASGIKESVATRIRGAEISCFSDGAKESLIVSSPLMDSGDGNCFIGSSNGVNSLFGHVKNLRIWHHALSDAQIKGLA